MSKRVIYIHTIDDQPGEFDGDQICFASNYRHRPNVPAESLAQIKREQRATLRYRKSLGFSNEGTKYGYVKYAV